MSGNVDLAARAAGRALTLLELLNQEHTCQQLHINARGVRVELESIQRWLGAQLASPDPGPARSRAVSTRRGSLRHQILNMIAEGGPSGFTDQELGLKMQERGFLPASARSRRWELLSAGWIRQATKDGRLWRRSGHTVWVVAENGLTALKRLESGQMVLALMSSIEPDQAALDTPALGG